MSTTSPSDSEAGATEPAPVPYAALALCAVLVGVHVASATTHPVFIEGLFFDRPDAIRTAVGGQHRQLVHFGEYWRLATSTLLHANALHLGFNVVGLWVLGVLLEPLVGSLRWLGLFVLGAVGGSVASQVAGVLMSDGASAGAFALLGGTLVIGWRIRDQLDDDDKQLWASLVGFTVLNIVLSVVLPFIDFIGHFGGLAVGLLLPWLMPLRREGPVEIGFWVAVLAGFVGVCAYGWWP